MSRSFLFLTALLAFSCKTQSQYCDIEDPHPSVCRPFKAGMEKQNDALDRVKPVAPIDEGSWVVSADLLIGAVDGTWLGAKSLKTGRYVWWYKLESPIAAPIGSFGSWIVIGLRDGRVLKLESLTGKKVWEGAFSKFISRPFELRGSILYAVSVNQVLVAIDFISGKSKWVYDPQETQELQIRGVGRPTVAEDKVYLTVSSGDIHALDRESGRLIWKTNPVFSEFRFHDVMGDVFVENQRMAVARYDGHVISFSTEKHSEIFWQHEFASVTTSLTKGGNMFVGCINGDIYSIDVRSGKKRWKSSVGKQAISHFLVSENVLYVAGSNGRVAALAAPSGKIIWHDDLDGSIERAPFVFNKKVYFSTGLKVLYGYHLN